MKHSNCGKISVLAMVLLLLAGAAYADPFVLRPKFPKVKPIAQADLAVKYDQAVIVDVRTAVEFDVIHIAKAKNIPMGKADFLAQLEKARAKNDSAPLALYCNGYTCAKSYEAAELAQESGFQNVFCYDAGIFEWTKAYPDKSVLLGKSPANKDKLISDDKLAKSKLSFADFKARAQAPNSVVIDVRDPLQRAKESGLDQSKNVELANIRSIPLDRLVGLLEKGEFKDKQLLIFDAVGKQVQWLQYYLEEYGYKNYAFMAKGVLSAVEAGAAK
jgi:rhodanese-related sulfurtransferase